MTKSPEVSIIILNYNTGHYLSDCLKSLYASKLSQFSIEIIVVDNASSDDSIAQSKKIKNNNSFIIDTKYLLLNTNLGFAAGNNQAFRVVNKNSKFILFLNPDTSVDPNTIEGMTNYFNDHSEVDAATCQVILASTGQLQPECHRGFPTPWNAFCYFFLPFLPNGYILNKDFTKVQIIDCCVGAFFMMKRQVGESVGWWNEKYFFYGEDLDFCYKIKQLGFKLFFIPNYKIIHYQGISSGIKKQKTIASRATKIRSAIASTNAMRIFYQENLIKNYPLIIHPVINLGINLLQFYRVFKAKYL